MLNVNEESCYQGYCTGMGCSICALENRLYSPLIDLIESQEMDDVVVSRCIIDACAVLNEAIGNKKDLLVILKNVLLLAVAAIRGELTDSVNAHHGHNACLSRVKFVKLSIFYFCPASFFSKWRVSGPWRVQIEPPVGWIMAGAPCTFNTRACST